MGRSFTPALLQLFSNAPYASHMTTRAMNERILNDGLHLAMEWGESWLQPIRERLGRLHPDLTPPELERYDKICREAMKRGHKLVPRCWREPGTNEQNAFASFSGEMLKNHPWISRENLQSLYSQGMYYAWKNGDIPL